MVNFLLGDVGGTNTRLARVRDGEVSPREIRCYRNTDYSRLEDIVTDYLGIVTESTSRTATRDGDGRIADSVSGAVFAVAGPVNGPVVELTNLAWRIDGDRLSAALGGAAVRLVNDFEALAQALPQLRGDDLVTVNDAIPQEDGVRCVLGPGTGFGMAILIPTASGRWHAVRSEGGHARLTVAGPHERRLLELFENELDYVAVEDAVSGPGLERTYRAIATLAGKPVGNATAASISDAAIAGTDPLADAALRQFVDWLARAASNLALTVLPRGGLYIGGGIAPRIVDRLSDGRFKSTYLEAGSQAVLLATFPVYVICAAHPTLVGASIIAQTDVGAACTGGQAPFPE